MRNLARDVRYASRRLRATPLFALFAVTTLALGIGSTTAVYSFVHLVTGPPPGVDRVDRIINVYHGQGGNISMLGMSWPDYQDFRSRQTSFDQVTAWSFFGGAFAGPAGSRSAFAEIVGGSYFQVLGVQPQKGRLLQAADERLDAPLVAVIGHGTWLSLYGGDDDVVGRRIGIDGHDFEIVGVAPREFRGLFNNGLVPSAAWVPLSAARVLAAPGRRLSLDPADRDRRWLLVKATLSPAHTIEAAAAEVRAIGAQLDASEPIGVDLTYGTRSQTGRAWTIKPMADVRVNESSANLVDSLAAVLMLAVAAVLLVACSNLGNLALARGSARRREVSVRYALGASRWRLVREAVVENLLLVVAGGLAGLGVARVVLAAAAGELSVAGSSATFFLEPRLDGSVLLAALAATALALLVCGVAPAVLSTRGNLREALATDGGSAPPRWRGRRYLIAGQVMASVVLLSVAAAAVHELRSQQTHDSGLDLDRLALAEVRFDTQGRDAVRARQILDAAATIVEGRDDVDRVSFASNLPALVGSGIGTLTLPDSPGDRWNPRIVAGTAGLLDTLGVGIIQGRAWTDADPVGANGVVVLSEWTANDVFGSSNVVGREVLVARNGSTDADRLTVIGVAADVDVTSRGDRDVAAAYVPFEQVPLRSALLIARSPGNSEPLVPAIRQAFSAVDRTLAIEQVGTARYIAGSTTLFFSIVAGIASGLGTFAWALALGGLYGILTHLVQGRTREIGLRIALGADRGQIIRMMLRQGLSPVVLGVIAGLLLGAISRLMLQPQLQRLVPALDLAVLALVPVLFLAAAFMACYLPALRAARVDPQVALKDW